MESQLVVWASKAIFKWPVTAVINYNCELLLRKVAKLCSMSLPPFMPVMEALMRELACGRRTPARRLHPWGRKAPRRGTCRFTPVCLPAKPHGQRSLAGYSPRGLREWDTTGLAHAHTHTYTHARVRAHTHTLSHTHRHSHTQTLTHTRTLTHTHTLTHTLTHSHTHSHTHTLTHTLTHTHTRIFIHLDWGPVSIQQNSLIFSPIFLSALLRHKIVKIFKMHIMWFWYGRLVEGFSASS